MPYKNDMSKPPRSFEEISILMVEHRMGGDCVRLMFPNGYGASIVRFNGSYGYEKGLWEVAVMTDSGPCYDTPITSDVIGYQSEAEVISLCQQIFDLPDLATNA
jgi:hypothetical protein